MSFYYVKGITIKNDSVSFTLADSSLRPLYFHKVGSDQLSEMLKTEGKQAVLANIGEDIWDGNFHLYKGTKLCNLFLEAKSALPSGLHWSNFDSKAAGEFLANAVIKLEQDRNVDLSEDINKLLALRNNKEHILEAVHRSGKNLLNFASEELQNDREFALEVIRAGAGRPHFDYPKAFAKDKEVALEGLKLNGCYYRELDNSLKADKDIILEAFADREGRQFHEHLPSMIPREVFNFKLLSPTEVSFDKDFAFKLIECCPSIHIHRASWMLEDRDVALKWCEVGKWIPNDVSYLPKKYAEEKKFQDILLSRCNTDKAYTILKQKFAEMGVELYTEKKPSLSSQLQAAKMKSSTQQGNSFSPKKEHSI